MRLIDLSPRLRAGMPGWPGDTAWSFGFTANIAPDCPVNVGRLETSTHVGSHADAPLHFDPAGAPIDRLPLDAFLGPCRVVDARGGSGLVDAQGVLAQLPERVERVLIRQYERHPAAWDEDLRGLDPALAAGLAARGVRLVGVDAASVDPAASKTLDAHHALGRAGILILEGLVLDQVEPGSYELIALPLPIEGGDASPVRAVLRCTS